MAGSAMLDVDAPFLPLGVLSICTSSDASSTPRFITESIKTLFLFTKSDIKTILIPVTIFATSTAPLHDRTCLPHIIFWLWLHILQCALANQIYGSEEDAVNKPDRPIPSGRITVFQATILRWASVLVCFAVSACYGTLVLKASLALAALLYIYNDLDLNSHWLTRNILNGAGLACFEVGATLIAGQRKDQLDSVSKLSIIISSSIFMTTIHTQDFKDELGDAKIGRRTLPMIIPVASRILVLVALVAWSIGLGYVWNLNLLLTGILLILGTIVGMRFVLYKSVEDDQWSFYLYNVWLSITNALPALTRAIL